MKTFINHILYHSTYLELYYWVTGYFFVLYFIVGQCFLRTCQVLDRAGIVHKITEQVVNNKQKLTEIKHSVVSILIFGLSCFPIVYGVRAGTITIASESVYNFILGLVILNVWNEVHFYLSHRLLHLPYLMNKVHFVHHQSVVPTTYSVYSFHWFEAMLLSTVPLTIVPFFSFSATAIAAYPLTSIIFNLCGHSNYRLGNGNGKHWMQMSTNHHEHHYSFSRSYGFVTTLFDKFLTKESKS